jgi:hypothetical protein
MSTLSESGNRLEGGMKAKLGIPISVALAVVAIAWVVIGSHALALASADSDKAEKWQNHRF